VSQESSTEVIEEALRLGRGYVLKAHAEKDLLAAVESILEGKQLVSSLRPARSQVDTPGFPALASRDGALSSRNSMVSGRNVSLATEKIV
jgi:DNA-binding NarL/FixJ family response regulator